MTATEQGTAMSEAWTPCPPGQACENCDHPLTAHWERNPKCGDCKCLSWRCKHGGFDWQPPRKAVYG